MYLRGLFSKRSCQVRSLFHNVIDGFKEWKFRTFNMLGEVMNKELITNIVAIGDSQIEIDAATQLSE